MAPPKEPLVWIDCEMTGLNPDTDTIMEIFCLITTGDLTLLEPEGFHAIIHHPASTLDKMDEWCVKTHGESGLTAACIASTTTADQAADDLLAYLKLHVPEPGTALLAGNSIHQDRLFLRQPPYNRAADHLHYRMLDVSSIKEAAKRWCDKRVLKKVPRKKCSHKARDDILESIEEAKYYQEVIFGPAGRAPESQTGTDSTEAQLKALRSKLDKKVADSETLRSQLSGREADSEALPSKLEAEGEALPSKLSKKEAESGEDLPSKLSRLEAESEALKLQQSRMEAESEDLQSRLSKMEAWTEGLQSKMSKMEAESRERTRVLAST